MPRYTQAQRSAVKDKILDAAESLVVRQGWYACTVRPVAKAAGVSYGPVHDHFKGFALKTELVGVAYANLVSAVEIALRLPVSLRQIPLSVAAYLRSNPQVSPLTVQVTALFAAPEAPGGEELRAAIKRTRASAAQLIQAALEGADFHDTRDQLASFSLALVRWFETACTLHAMCPDASLDDLTGLILGFKDLR